MTSLAPIVAIALAIATFGSSYASPRATRVINGVTWLVALGGFAFLQFGGASPQLSVALATAAVTALAMLRTTSSNAQTRQAVLGFGAVVPLAVSIAALVAVTDANTSWSRHVVLYTAAWAAMLGGVSTLLSAAAIVRGPAGPGVGIAAAGAIGAIAVAGTGRSSLPETFYGFPLSTDAGRLMWELPPVPGFEDGLRLLVAAPLPQLFYALLAVGGVAGVFAVAAYFPKHPRRVAAVAATLGAGAVSLLASLQPTIAGLVVPGNESYVGHVKRLLLTRNVADRVMTAGDWSADGDIFVSLAGIAPEIVGLTICGGIGLLAALSWWRDEGLAHPVADREAAPLDAARGVGLLWLGWFVAMLVHEAYLGSPGLGAPGEWVVVGVLLTAVGLTAIGWKPTNALTMRVSELSAGIVVALVFVVAGFAFRFGAPLGFSISVF